MKDFARIVNLVWKNLLANGWRTVLTLSGIVVSVAAIIVVITLGESVKGYVLDQVESYGTQTIQVEIKVPSNEHISTGNMAGIAMGVQITTLTLGDLRAISNLEGVQIVAPGLMGQEVIGSRGDNVTAILMGTTSTISLIDTQTIIAEGGFWSEQMEQSAARVVVLGSGIKNDLFGEMPAIGKTVKIKGQLYKVVGVLQERGSMLGMSFDDFVYLPVKTLSKKIMGVDYIQFVTVRVSDNAVVDDVADDIVALLQMRHNTSGDDDDFGVTTMKQMQDMMNNVFVSITALLLLLAAISLLVGGVGIMNVMLVAVTERMREIGLRKALGATNKDIKRQFLTEAVVISLAGAIFGVALGVLIVLGASWVIAQKQLDVPVVMTWLAPTVGIGFSVVAGIAFGLIPARKAAKISPMEAIRKS